MSQSKKKIKPSYYFEKKLWSKGIEFIAGADEVGRGCFAGPVVAAVVAFAPDYELGERIDDSKKLTYLQRTIAEKWIKKNVLTWGVGEASTALINRLGMGKATKVAFRKAVKAANLKLKVQNEKLEYLLIDAFYVPYLRSFPRSKQLAITKGDGKSISIAAASIVAKVYRDSLMEKIGNHSRYKKYDWENNKGYGTKNHQEAILNYGITGYHRKQFVDTFLNNFSSSRVQSGA
ncbi:MAG: ribonuclease HII [Patescibacteria group bacterium]